MPLGSVVGSVYLHPGLIFAEAGEHEITTVLGSCIAVCLWDPRRRIGGMNHFLLPLWNGDGLPSPRYGNIAVARLIERLRELGSQPQGLQAKLFGGGGLVTALSGTSSIGERNAVLAQDLLAAAGVPVVAQDVGGTQSRRIRFHTATGEVFLKRLSRVGPLPAPAPDREPAWRRRT
jgi:chemotaxis protein CheD